MKFKFLKEHQMFSLRNKEHLIYKKTKEKRPTCCTKGFNAIVKDKKRKKVFVTSDEDVLPIFKDTSDKKVKLANGRFAFSFKKRVKNKGVSMLLSQIPMNSPFIYNDRVYKIVLEGGNHGNQQFEVIDVETLNKTKISAKAEVSLESDAMINNNSESEPEPAASELIFNDEDETQISDVLDEEFDVYISSDNDYDVMNNENKLDGCDTNSTEEDTNE